MARTPDAQELGLAFVTPDGVVRLVIGGGRCQEPEPALIGAPPVVELPRPRLVLVPRRGRRDFISKRA